MKRITAVVLSVVVFLMAFPLFAFAVTSQKYSSLPEPVPDDRNKFLVVSNGSKNIIVWISTPLFSMAGETSGVEMYIELTSDGYVLHTVAPSLGFSYEVQKFDALTGEFIWSGWHSVPASSNDDAYTIPSLSGYKYYVSYGMPVKKLSSVTGYELLPITWNGNGNTEMALIQSSISSLNSKIDTLNSRVNTLNGSVDNIESDVDDISTLVAGISMTVDSIDSELVLLYNRLNTTNTRLQSIIDTDTAILNYLKSELPKIETKLDTLHSDLVTLHSDLNIVISQLDDVLDDLDFLIEQVVIANDTLDQINSLLADIYAILASEAETFSSQDTSELDEYASREEELMSDRSQEIGSAFDQVGDVLDSGAISSINNLLTQFVFGIPELSALIIFCLAMGLGVLILGRKVG